MSAAFTCPHCGGHGISLVSKLISSGASYWGWPMTCRLCGQRARISGGALNAQFVLFLAALATLPWLLGGEARLIAGYLVAAVILAVGLFAPLRKDLLA